MYTNRKIVKKLINEANLSGGDDNATVIVIKIKKINPAKNGKSYFRRLRSLFLK